MTVGGKTLTFDKQKAPAPKDAERAARTGRVEADEAGREGRRIRRKLTDMLTTLSNLRAEKFADKPLHSGEELVVTREVRRRSGGPDHRGSPLPQVRQASSTRSLPVKAARSS